MGLTFLQGTGFADLYRNGAVIGLHGSWNRTTPTGYKVAYFPWDSATQQPGAQIDLVTGWLTPQGAWGRPVDAAVDQQGNLLISDDGSGTIYKLTYGSQSTPPATPSPVPTATPSMPPVIRSVVRLPLIFNGAPNGVPVPPTQP